MAERIWGEYARYLTDLVEVLETFEATHEDGPTGLGITRVELNLYGDPVAFAVVYDEEIDGLMLEVGKP